MALMNHSCYYFISCVNNYTITNGLTGILPNLGEICKSEDAVINVRWSSGVGQCGDTQKQLYSATIYWQIQEYWDLFYCLMKLIDTSEGFLLLMLGIEFWENIDMVQ